MNALFLKCFAMLTMLIDHTAVVLQKTEVLAYTDSIYRIMRGIGRVAFPIFCFQLVQGVYHSKNLKKYGLRLLIFALLSEIPFDFALRLTLNDPRHQNVFFTLLFGFLITVMMKEKIRGAAYRERIVWGTVILAATLGLAKAATAFYFDYGASGVLMIAIMGLYVAVEDELRFRVPQRSIALIFAALGTMYCAFTKQGLEYWALAALLPIALYNGEKGYSGIAGRLLYGFYPLHLLILGLIFVLPAL